MIIRSSELASKGSEGSVVADLHREGAVGRVDALERGRERAREARHPAGVGLLLAPPARGPGRVAELRVRLPHLGGPYQ